MAELPVVDEGERRRVRHGLVSYKELHDIGDPELRERMEFQGIQVALRSLQRFIAGTHRTDDIMVRRYAKFLSMVAPPPVGDTLGGALAKFIALGPLESGWSDGFAGTYRTFARPHGPGQEKPDAAKQDTASFRETRSVVKLEPASDPTFLRATEIMTGLPGKEESVSMQWLGNTGVFAPLGEGRYLLMVRSILELRCYQLKKMIDAPLTLHGYAMQTETEFSRLQIPPWQPVSEFVMSALADGKSA